MMGIGQYLLRLLPNTTKYCIPQDFHGSRGFWCLCKNVTHNITATAIILGSIASYRECFVRKLKFATASQKFPATKVLHYIVFTYVQLSRRYDHNIDQKHYLFSLHDCKPELHCRMMNIMNTHNNGWYYYVQRYHLALGPNGNWYCLVGYSISTIMYWILFHP